MRLTKLLIALKLTFGAALYSLGNTEYQVTNPYDGKIPYLVVSEDENGSSHRKPGLYFRDVDGKEIQLIEGPPLMGGSTQGVVAQLEATTTSGQYEAIVVFGGAVYITGFQEAGKRLHSAIKLGSEDMPLFDPVSKRNINIPPVTSVENISVLQGSLERGTQAVLFSLRYDKPSVFGTGITAILLVSSDQMEENKLKFDSRLVVLDYEFHPREIQSRFLDVYKHNSTAIAPAMVTAILEDEALPYVQTVPAVAKWRESSQRILKSFLTPATRIELGKLEQLPQLVLEDVSIIHPEPILDNPLAEDSGSIVIRYMPTLGRALTRVSGDAELPYPVAIDKVGKYRAFSSKTIANVSFLVVGGVLKVVLVNDARKNQSNHVHILDIDAINRLAQISPHMNLRAAEIKDLTFTYHKKPGRSPDGIILLISALFESGGAVTVAQEIDLFRNSLITGDSLTINQEFYSEVELEHRSILKDGDIRDRHEALMFDHHEIEDGALYVHSETRLHLNLSKSLKEGKLVREFLKPAKNIEIGQNVAYLEYVEDETEVSQTGMYARDDSDRVRNIGGQLLPSPFSGESKKSFSLLVREIQVTSSVKAKMSFYAMDNSFRHGENRFSLVGVLSDFVNKKGDPVKLAPMVVSLAEVRFPIKLLSGFDVVTGRKDFSRHFYVFLNFDDPDSEKKEPGERVYLTKGIRTHLDIKNERSKVEVDWQVDGTEDFLTKGFMPEIVNRLLIHKTGRICWITTPELDAKSDPEFAVYDLSEGKKVNPGKQGRSNVYRKFRTGDGEDQNLSFATGEYYNANWRIAGTNVPAKVVEYYASNYGLSDGKKKKEDSEAEIEASNKGTKSIFDPFSSTLESIADNRNTGEKRIVLVSEKDKGGFIRYFTDQMKNPRLLNWNHERQGTDFYLLQAQHLRYRDFSRNLASIRGSQGKRNQILIADGADLMTGGFIQPDGEDEDDGDEEFSVQHGPAHALYLLANEGDAISQDEFENFRPEMGRVKALVFMTPDELRVAAQAAAERHGEAFLNAFTIDNSCLYFPWRMHPPDSSGALGSIRQYQHDETADVESRLFPTVTHALARLADGAKDPKHIVLIVPDSLNDQVYENILRQWAYKRSGTSGWNYQNRDLWLYQLPSGSQLKQDGLLRGLQQIKGVAGRRHVLVNTLDDVLDAGRLDKNNSSAAFAGMQMIQDPLDTEIEEARKFPHAMYLLSQEGNLECRENCRREIGMLFVGTSSEWEQVKAETEFEQRFSDFLTHTEVVELSLPSVEARVEQLQEIFSRREIKAIGYEFSIKVYDEDSNIVENPSQDLQRQKLIEYTVNRIDELARRLDKEPIRAFLDAVSAIKTNLVRNNVLRQNPIISVQNIELVLSNVFTLPLNIRNLPDDDLLKVLSDEEKTIHKIQDAGARGAIDLWLEVIHAVMAQTEQSPTKRVPASIILFGPTGTGKTFIFETLCNVLGLQTYKFDQENNDDAQAFVINFRSMRKGGLTGKDVVKHLEAFLTGPLGHRGFILLDDAHEGTEEDKREIMSFIQGLHDAPENFVAISDEDGIRHRVPLANLTLMMTLNPYPTNYDTNTTKRIVAALKRDGKSILDEAAINRWNKVIEWNQFHFDAKAPGLRDQLAKAVLDELTSDGPIPFVTSRAVRHIVEANPTTDSRNFLDQSVNALLNLPEDDAESKVYVVAKRAKDVVDLDDPYRRIGRVDNPLEASPKGGSQDVKARVTKSVREGLMAIPLSPHKFEGQAHLLEMIVDAERLMAVKMLVENIQSDPALVRRKRLISQDVPRIILGLHDHINEIRDIPTEAFSLQFEDLMADGDAYYKLIAEKTPARRFRPAPFSFEDEIDDVFYQRSQHRVDESRRHVVTDLAYDLKQWHERLLEIMLRVDSIHELPRSSDWLKSLSLEEPLTAIDSHAAQLRELFNRFIGALGRRDLTEATSGGFPSPDLYGVTRLFAYAMDKSLVMIDWAPVTRFLTSAVNLAKGNIELGNRPEVQAYLFKSKYTIFRPLTLEQVVGTMEVSHHFRKEREKIGGGLSSKFAGECQSYFASEAEQ